MPEEQGRNGVFTVFLIGTSVSNTVLTVLYYTIFFSSSNKDENIHVNCYANATISCDSMY